MWVKKISFGFVISEKMAIEYDKIFHIPFKPLMNCIDNEKYMLNAVNYKNNEEIVFSYFGGLHLKRWETLLILAKALKELSHLYTQKLVIKIYTSSANRNSYSSSIIIENVKFCNSIDHELVITKMLCSDFLIHVESFDEDSIKYTRLSISTKIPEYLASRIPIIAIGPVKTASIEYLIDNECAYVASSSNYEGIKKMLIEALSAKNKEKILLNGQQTICKNHSKTQIELFEQSLCMDFK